MIGAHGYKAKRWPHDESARVPFLIRYPRAIRGGLVVPDPFSTVDVYPTLTSLAGLKAPTGIDGMDYSGLLTGKSARAPRDYAFLQMMYAYVPWPGWRALRLREYSYARTGKGPWLLFNNAKDPFQTKNLVDDPSSRTLVAEMDRRLAALMKENGDSWEYKATTGDLEAWVPGGGKQRSQSLGVPWPGGEPGAAPRAGRRKAARSAGSRRRRCGSSPGCWRWRRRWPRRRCGCGCSRRRGGTSGRSRRSLRPRQRRRHRQQPGDDPHLRRLLPALLAAFLPAARRRRPGLAPRPRHPQRLAALLPSARHPVSPCPPWSPCTPTIAVLFHERRQPPVHLRDQRPRRRIVDQVLRLERILRVVESSHGPLPVRA